MSTLRLTQAGNTLEMRGDIREIHSLIEQARSLKNLGSRPWRPMQQLQEKLCAAIDLWSSNGQAAAEELLRIWQATARTTPKTGERKEQQYPDQMIADLLVGLPEATRVIMAKLRAEFGPAFDDATNYLGAVA